MFWFKWFSRFCTPNRATPQKGPFRWVPRVAVLEGLYCITKVSETVVSLIIKKRRVLDNHKLSKRDGVPSKSKLIVF